MIKLKKNQSKKKHNKMTSQSKNINLNKIIKISLAVSQNLL
jgi:hypothetical protein